jgi:2-polyprenyl-3-methyl-5-hydroxy-6-metoxy-1,4-benzoquinol methylase
MNEKLQVVEKESYWTAWSLYWSYLEDFFLDLEAINQLAAFITNPVLIIGAGQGLLVEQLQKNGLSVNGIDSGPRIVSYAKERRELNLIQVNTTNLPFVFHYVSNGRSNCIERTVS